MIGDQLTSLEANPQCLVNAGGANDESISRHVIEDIFHKFMDQTVTLFEALGCCSRPVACCMQVSYLRDYLLISV